MIAVLAKSLSPVLGRTPKRPARAPLVVRPIYSEESKAHPNSTPKAQTLKSRRPRSALKEAPRYRRLGNSALSITLILTSRFPGRRLRRMNAIAMPSAQNRDATEKLEPSPRNSPVNFPKTIWTVPSASCSNVNSITPLGSLVLQRNSPVPLWPSVYITNDRDKLTQQPMEAGPRHIIRR